jgi:diguanylate cyclase (GGDEF)-like protein
MEHARQRHQTLSLLNINIDNTRMINERWGLGAVDKVLHQFAQLCQKHLQEEDLMGRISDHGFSLLLIGRDEPTVLRLALNLYASAIAMPGLYTNTHFHLRVRIGVTPLVDSDKTFEDLFRRANRALEVARYAGSDRVAFVQ